MKKLLITGASGFIGSFLVEEGLRRGYEVFAGLRKNSSRQFLTDPRIRFIEFDFSDQEGMRVLLQREGPFDYIIHNAGVTKAALSDTYFRVNRDHTAVFIKALEETGTLHKKLVYISSLAAFGPLSDAPPARRKDTDEAHPVTSYGKSKLEAEQFLFNDSKLPFVIIRPTNVYGPRERDLHIFFKMINRGMEFYIGRQEQWVSFVFVADLVQGIFNAVESPVIGKAYFITDGNDHTAHSFGQTIKKTLGKKTVQLAVPVSIIRPFTRIADIFGNAGALNTEKLNELTGKNWLCDIGPARTDLGYVPRYDLEKGIAETVRWYRENRWL